MFEDLTDGKKGGGIKENAKPAPDGPATKGKIVVGVPHNKPCYITDCKYYSGWTVNHPINGGLPGLPGGSGGGSGTITIDSGYSPFWCMCCRQFKGVEAGRRK